MLAYTHPRLPLKSFEGVGRHSRQSRGCRWILLGCTSSRRPLGNRTSLLVCRRSLPVNVLLHLFSSSHARFVMHPDLFQLLAALRRRQSRTSQQRDGIRECSCTYRIALHEDAPSGLFHLRIDLVLFCRVPRVPEDWCSETSRIPSRLRRCSTLKG